MQPTLTHTALVLLFYILKKQYILKCSKHLLHLITYQMPEQK